MPMRADDLDVVSRLKAKGWSETGLSEYAKGNWRVGFDTSSWMIVSTEHNERVFDVHVPGNYESAWTVNLIEHLCQMEDERGRLRKALERIRDNPTSDADACATAIEALRQCYHTWLVNVDVAEGQRGRVHCPICGARQE
jgi:hypothetical protein